MGIFMAVAEESEQEPKLIILEHNASAPTCQRVVLVGKGVTFDSGGISHQARRGDVADEGRHGGRGRRDCGARRRRPPEPAAARGRPGAVRGEPARRPRAEAGRCLRGHDRQDDGSDQHGRRGPHAAGRRARLRRAFRPGGRGRHRHAHRCPVHGARPARGRVVRQRRRLSPSGWSRPRRRATDCGGCHCTTSTRRRSRARWPT